MPSRKKNDERTNRLEGVEVFSDPSRMDIEDDRDYDEIRWNLLGGVGGRLLVVTYTERGEVTRIISARGAEPYERRKYHNLQA